MEKVLNELIFELKKQGVSICTAEQCTCGLVGATIATQCTDTPLYKGSITTYDNENLEKVLDVSHNAIKNNGVVSSQVACQMAIGGLYKLNADMCIGVVGDIKNGVVWLCSAKHTPRTLDFKYKQLVINGSNSDKYSKVLEEAIEIILMHILEEVNG